MIDLEPVDSWQPYLKKMYETDSGYFEFQVRVWNDRAWIQDKTDNIIFMERSPYFTKNTFVKQLYVSKKFTDEQYEMLNSLYNKTDNLWMPDKFIYLKVSPETSFQRIQQRLREGEDRISFNYIQRLHEHHEKTYTYLKNQGYDVVVIDGEKTINEIVDEIKKIVE
eukprot:764955-Hanusia_phi.AAC.6